MIVPVILSGGSGTRLWPLSRKHHPKQFLNLINNDSTLFQDTVLRLPKDIGKPLVICNEEHRFLVAEQLREIGVNNCDIILDPNGKNTAPAVTLAALKFSNSKEDPILLVLSTDHLIQNNSAFLYGGGIFFSSMINSKLINVNIKICCLQKWILIITKH